MLTFFRFIDHANDLWLMTIADYSAGEYKGQLPVDPPGYAIQEGYEGFLVPMKSGVVTGLITALVIVSVLLGLLVLKVLKLPFLVLLLLKFKKILKLKWLQLKLKKIKKPVGRLLADDHHLLQLTRFIFSAIDRLASLQDQTTQSNWLDSASFSIVSNTFFSFNSHPVGCQSYPI